MVEWSRAFGGVPILLHAADREWVMRDAPAIEYWEGGTRELWDGMTLVRCGGHFAGGAIAHVRSEEHTSELQSLMRNSYAVFCLKKNKTSITDTNHVCHLHVN